MQQLTGLDASFLALETANTTGHVGGLAVLDPSGAPKPLTLARLTEVLAQRIPLRAGAAPQAARRTAGASFDQPYWIDPPAGPSRPTRSASTASRAARSSSTPRAATTCCC